MRVSASRYMSDNFDFTTVHRPSVCFVLLSIVVLLVSACDKRAPDETGQELMEETNEVNTEDVSEDPIAGATPLGNPNEAYWRMESDGTIYEGRLSLFFVLDGDPMIQFVNQDAVNVGLAFNGEMSGVQTVTFATFADARGPVCERVGEVDAFQITFGPSEKDWLTGSFTGMLGCPDYSLMPVNGSFHIRAPEERP